MNRGKYAPVVYYDDYGYGTSRDVSGKSHNQMVKIVEKYRNDAIASGASAAQANQGANYLAGAWYQENGKYR
jgi:hypothetical protein